MSDDKRSMEITILLDEYKSFREEVLLHFKNAKTHSRYFQVFAGGCLLIIWYLFVNSQTNIKPVLDGIGISQQTLIICLIITMNTVAYYFAFDILDSYFCIFLAVARLIALEKHINAILNKTLLVWESQFQPNPVASKGWSRVGITFFQAFLVVVASVILPILSYVVLLLDPASPKVLVYFGIIWCIGLLAVFVITFYDVFIRRRQEAIDLMERLVAKARPSAPTE